MPPPSPLEQMIDSVVRCVLCHKSRKACRCWIHVNGLGIISRKDYRLYVRAYLAELLRMDMKRGTGVMSEVAAVDRSKAAEELARLIKKLERDRT